MTREERGLFIDMLAFCWDNEGLPNDDRAVREIASCAGAELDKVWKTVRACFVVKAGRLWNEKLWKLRSEYRRISRVRARAARQANAPQTPSKQGAGLAQVAHTNGGSASAVASASASAPASPKPNSYSVEFVTAWGNYPRRSGNNPKGKAFRAWNARRGEGVESVTMLEGVARYAAWCEATGKLRTETVMMASTFFGPDRPFEQEWDLPAQPLNRLAAVSYDAARSAYRKAGIPDDVKIPQGGFANVAALEKAIAANTARVA